MQYVTVYITVVKSFFHSSFFSSMWGLAHPRHFVILAALITSLLLFNGSGRMAFLFIIAFLSTFGIVSLIKNTLRVPRPIDPLVETIGYSFPSGHAAAGGFFATSITYLMAQQFSGIIVLLVSALVVAIGVSIAVSRVFLRAHTIPQVLVGLIIGVSVPFIVFHYQHALIRFFFG